MEWQLKTIPASKSLVTPRVLIQGAIPVLLSSAGSYAEFVTANGDTSRDQPHVEVSLSEAVAQGPEGKDRWVDTVYVFAVGARKNGRQQAI